MTRGQAERLMILKAWKSPELRKELLENPKAVIQRETGVDIPDGIEMEALEETTEKLYFVLPLKPAGFEDLSDEELDPSSPTRRNMLEMDMCK